MFKIKHTYNEIYEDFGFSSVNLRIIKEEKTSQDREDEYIELLGVFDILRKKKIKIKGKFKEGTTCYINAIENKINNELSNVKNELNNYPINKMDVFFKELEVYIKVPALWVDISVKKEMCDYLSFFFKQLEKIKGGN